MLYISSMLVKMANQQSTKVKSHCFKVINQSPKSRWTHIDLLGQGDIRHINDASQEEKHLYPSHFATILLVQQKPNKM